MTELSDSLDIVRVTNGGITITGLESILNALLRIRANLVRTHRETDKDYIIILSAARRACKEFLYNTHIIEQAFYEQNPEFKKEQI